MGKKPEESVQEQNSENAMDDSEIGLKSAAEELLAAIEGKHSEGIVSALKSFMDMCHGSESEEMPEESQPE